MGYTKETWMQLSDEEKCDILNSYKGKTSKWKEDNPDCSWTTATKNTNYWKDKNEKFMPGLTPEFMQKQSDNTEIFTQDEIQYLKSLCKNKNVDLDKNMTLRGLNKKDAKTVTFKISKELYNKLMTWVESDDNEYGFSQHQVVSILLRNFMEDKNIPTPPEKATKKSTKSKKEIKEEIIEETVEEVVEDVTIEEPETTEDIKGIEFLSN